MILAYPPVKQINYTIKEAIMMVALMNMLHLLMKQKQKHTLGASKGPAKNLMPYIVKGLHGTEYIHTWTNEGLK